jgi:hypothetical protein
MALLETKQVLDNLHILYRAGFQNPFIDNALYRIVERQIERDQDDLARVEAELEQFEARFGLSSEEFFERFQQGQLEDSADFMEWNAFCKMKDRIQQRLTILQKDIES